MVQALTSNDRASIKVSFLTVHPYPCYCHIIDLVQNMLESIEYFCESTSLPPSHKKESAAADVSQCAQLQYYE